MIYYRPDRDTKISTGLKNGTKAELYGWLIKWQTERDALINFDSRFHKHTAAQLFPHFIEEKMAMHDRPAKSSFAGYDRAVKHFAKEPLWHTKPLKDVTYKDAQAYIVKFSSSGFNPNRDVKFLKQLKSWAIETEKIQAFPLKIRTPVKRRGESIGRRITDDEIERLVKEISVTRSAVAWIQFRMGLRMGLRRQEVSKTFVGWIDWDTQMLCLPAKFTKTRQAREVPIPADMLDDLRKLAEGKRPDEPMFARGPVTAEDRKNIGKWWENAKKRAGVNCRFHDLRVTCATRMAEAGVPMAYAIDILGHSEDVNKIYVKTLNRAKKTEEFKKVGWDTKWDTSRFKDGKESASSDNSVQSKENVEPEKSSNVFHLKLK